MIETDIHMTKDRELILIHDNFLERTTNGTGLVREHTLSEINCLDAQADIMCLSDELVENAVSLGLVKIFEHED